MDFQSQNDRETQQPLLLSSERDCETPEAAKSLQSDQFLQQLRDFKTFQQSITDDKLTPVIYPASSSSNSDSSHNLQTSKNPFRRQHAFSTSDDIDLDFSPLDTAEEESEPVATSDESQFQIPFDDGDYGDIQFFHHKLLFQQNLGQSGFLDSSVSSFGSNALLNIRNAGGVAIENFHLDAGDASGENGIDSSFSENPFVFPDNVMEYGEPQFFPGNCVGYLETILEETDEEFEEEEGCSGRHWWTADSDTDTDSVIRVDNGQKRHGTNNNHSSVQSGTSSNLKSVEKVEDLSLQSTFRSSASSRPFELEDLHLLDQLDLAFEETLMEPRKRSGIAAFSHQLHLIDKPFEGQAKHLLDAQGNRVTLQRSASHDGERTVFSSNELIVPEILEKQDVMQVKNGSSAQNGDTKLLGNAESKETFGSSLSPSSSDSEPHEVAEEDFFYSSPGSDESEEGSSSSDDSEKHGAGVVLAEFSLGQPATTANSGGLTNNNSFSSGSLYSGNGRNGRAVDSAGSSRLKSFRSFDSLNSLSGTEMLFSKADTFPSFHYIKEDVEPGSSSSGSGSGSPSSAPRCNHTSSSTNDVAASGRHAIGAEEESQSLPSHHSGAAAFPAAFAKITKKSSHSSSTSTASSSGNSASGMVSTENLSEDSGIGPDGTAKTPETIYECDQSHRFGQSPDQDVESAKEYVEKSEFALNPLVFSSISSSETTSGTMSLASLPSLSSHSSHQETSGQFPLSNEGDGNSGGGDSQKASVAGLPLECKEMAASHCVATGRNCNDEMEEAISHNSSSNFHCRRVEKGDAAPAIESQSKESNIASDLQGMRAEQPTTTSYHGKLPISTNDHEIATTAALPQHASSNNPLAEGCGLHPSSDVQILASFSPGSAQSEPLIQDNNIDKLALNSQVRRSSPNVPLNFNCTSQVGTSDIKRAQTAISEPHRHSSRNHISHSDHQDTTNSCASADSAAVIGSCKTATPKPSQLVAVSSSGEVPYVFEKSIAASVSTFPPSTQSQTSEKQLMSINLANSQNSNPENFHQERSYTNLKRERSRSESEFELVESALADANDDDTSLGHKDNMSLNSPTCPKASSRMTIDDNNKGSLLMAEHGGESAQLSTLRSGPRMDESGGGSIPTAIGGVSTQKVVRGRGNDAVQVFSSSSSQSSGSWVGNTREESSSGQCDGERDVNANRANDNNNSIELRRGVESGGISLHHQQQENGAKAANAHDEAPQRGATNTELVVVIKGLLPSKAKDNNNKVSRQEQKPVGQEINRVLKASRSVSGEESSSAHHSPQYDDHKERQVADLGKTQWSAATSSDVVGNIHPRHLSSSQTNSDKSQSDERLVIAKPIQPLPIGVAEVKKFQSQSDSSLGSAHRATYHPHQLPDYQNDGDVRRNAESETIRLGNEKTQEQSILGTSNFGFFGRSSSKRARRSRDCASDTTTTSSTGRECSATASASTNKLSSWAAAVDEASRFTSDPSSTGSKKGAAECEADYEEEFVAYGFPAQKKRSYPSSDLGGGNISGRGKTQGGSSRERGYLHLEDIKCGIRPENFTVPLGVYSATVLAVAPSLPSQTLLFVNDGKSAGELTAQTETREKSGAASAAGKRGSLGQDTSVCSAADECGAGRLVTDPPVQANGSLVVSTNSSSPSAPDILVLKQTDLHGSDCDKELRIMEVDIDVSNGGGVGGERRSTSPSGPVLPIKTRTYGPRNEVEVVLVSSRTPSPAPAVGAGSSAPSSSLKQTHPSTSSSVGEDGNNEQSSNGPCPKIPRTRVHFSPVVSEISWRESYIDQGSEFSDSTEDITKRLAEMLRNTQFDSSTISAGSASNCDCEFSSGNSESNVAVKPLQVRSDNMELQQGRQGSPGCGKGPILVEKVQMRSSLLQGGEDDDEAEELERKLSRLCKGDNLRARSPVDEDFKGPMESNSDHLDNAEESVTETVEVRNGAVGKNHNGSANLYEEMHVEIEPSNQKSGSTTLSMVPDLLSQCENASNAQTFINVNIEEVTPHHQIEQSNSKTRNFLKPLRKSHSPSPQRPDIPPPPPLTPTPELQHQNQQQIFPKIFAEDTKKVGTKSDSKTNSSSSLNKTKKAAKGVVVSPGKKSVENTNRGKEANNKDKEIEASKENKNKSSKPGFFERLSKIRLSGSKSKKQKIHPKADEVEQLKGVQPLKSQNAVNLNGNGTKSQKLPSQPILKKSSGELSQSHLTHHPSQTEMAEEPEPDDSNKAFENILQEIAGIKNIQMRMDKSSSESSPQRPTSPPKDVRGFAKRKQFYTVNSSSPSPSAASPTAQSMLDLDKKLSQFKEETSKTRVVISKSHPDLELIEDLVRQQSASPEPSKGVDTGESIGRNPSANSDSPNKSCAEPKKSPKKSVSEVGQKNEREWYKLLKSAAEKYYYKSVSNKEDGKTGQKTGGALSGKTGVVETDLDTGTSREMLDGELVELEIQVPQYTVSTSEIPSSTSSGPITTIASSPSAKARSLTNLSSRLPLSIAPINYDESAPLSRSDLNDFDERAKSYEFLLDDNQKSSSVPPENNLRMEARKLSDHELRIQRSLQRLNVPDWYKNHESRTSTPTEKEKILNRRSDYGSSGGLAGGWKGLSTFKAPSMSSLQSSNGGRYSGSLNRSNFVRGRPATMSASRLSRESLAGSASHSPSAYDRCSFTYGMPFAMTRFGQGRLSSNSGTITPNSIADSNASTSGLSYTKKPYLGWRSQERLNALAGISNTDGPPKLSIYLPPEERLAADLLKAKAVVRPPASERPPLPKPPPRSEKTSLTSNGTSVADTSRIPMNSIPPPITSSPPQATKDEKDANVHNSIREVTKAINQLVLQDDKPPKPQPRKKSPGKKAVWIESSFVGRKPN